MQHLTVNASIILFFSTLAIGQNPDDFKYKGSFDPAANKIRNNFQFNGYTNHWHDITLYDIKYRNLITIR